jgi:prolyl oligopeptidase
VDALAEAEGVAWKLNALQPSCLPPDFSRCMLGLSDGESDAVVLREFDMRAREFVDGGFATTTPSRSWAAWADSGSLLIATDVGEGSLTAAMYPRVLKLWRRGQTLEEATTVMEADPGDLLGTWPMSFSMGGAVRSFVAVIKGMSEAEFYYFDEGVNPVQLPVPVHFALPGLLGAVGGQLVFQTAQDWSDGDRTVARGSLIGFDLARWLDDPTADALEVVFEPSNNRFLPVFFGVGVTSERVWFVVLDNIAGTLFSGIPGAGGWTVEQHETPSLSTVGIKGADPTLDLALVSIEGFLTPPSTHAVQGGRIGEAMMTDEPLFDASRYVVEQKYASSADGTQIPYFLVRSRDLEFDGASPTLIYAYGNPDDPKMRAVLEAYSPFHNVRSDTDYPEAFFYASTATPEQAAELTAMQAVYLMQKLGLDGKGH